MFDAAPYADRSGTIAAGGAAQELLPAKPSRRGYAFFNNSVEDLLIHPAGTATATRGIRVAAGALYEHPTNTPPPTGAVSIFGATTGAAYTCWEW